MLFWGHMFFLALTTVAIMLGVYGGQGRRIASYAILTIVVLSSCFTVAISGRSAMETRGNVPPGSATEWYQAGAFHAAKVAGSGVPHIVLSTAVLILLGNIRTRGTQQPPAR